MKGGEARFWSTSVDTQVAECPRNRSNSRPRLAHAQSWLAISGVALVAGGWVALLLALPWARGLLVAGGAVQAGAALLFVLLMGALLREPRSRA